MKITNTQAGPRGINAVSGPVLIEPNQTVEVAVYDRECQHIEATGWFSVEGDYEPNPGEAQRPPMNDDSAHKDALASKDRQITELKETVKAKDKEIADLKKQADAYKPDDPPSERDTLKARATELKLEFAKNISTDKLKELVRDAELDAMTDTELKTFLGTKGVTTADETREQLIELAKAA